MTIGEANTFIRCRNVHEVETSVSLAWRTINFLGAFVSSKLENLDKYLPETASRKAKIENKKASLEERLNALAVK